MSRGAREVVASAARTTSGESVQWSFDGGTTYFIAEPADTLTQMTGVVKKVKKFDVKAPGYKVVWAIAGTTPSFTFDIGSYVR